MSSIEPINTPAGQISGQVLFYSQPEPLTAEAHGKLGLKTLDAPYAFAASANAMPALVSEFGPSSTNYPIIFAGEQKAPMIILGLRPGESLFVDAAGRFEEGAYMPAFLRRYPFVLAGQDGQDQMVVCIDRNAPMLQDGGDVPLFVDGALSPFSEGAIEFCRTFETERQRTEQFVKRLVELDLFEPRATTFTPRAADGSQGQPIQLADYFAVSEEKLAALPDAQVRELLANGALRQIHVHLNSLLNWERLVARAGARAPIAANA